ncbi:hypothetical protein C2G38_2150288 [Gigaspora rosea]|uniref:HAT C-terminal dimerisation domain-containing protein n=1 Tax=Gigaspora rosea TaxID=44941 RepID=A0A397TUM8_9GLOM|nr:hypothetical protein C2G38_2150288 [Gigaspora rosea]
MSSSEEDSNISASTTDKGKKNIGGRPYGPVWEYFTKGAELRLLIEKMNITGGGLKNYSKTRWTTASDTIESILLLENVLKKIVEDGIFTNDQISNLGFKNGQFSRIITIVGSIWQKFGRDRASGNILIAHLQLYKENKYPYDATYVQGHDIPITWWNSIEPIPNYLQELALKILAIVPNSASCERNFSLLTWLTGNKRIQIDIQKLETIAKLHTYYNSNAKKELSYFADEMNENEVLKILNQTNIETFEKILEEEDLDKDEF